MLRLIFVEIAIERRQYENEQAILKCKKKNDSKEVELGKEDQEVEKEIQEVDPKVLNQVEVDLEEVNQEVMVEGEAFFLNNKFFFKSISYG